ncbi:dynamin-related protein 4c-like, partial [Trifolium pratense]
MATNDNPMKILKILSALEVEEKMERGLCLLCDELFTPDHAKHKRIRFKVIEMDEVDVEPESEASSKNNMKYSTHNLQIDFQQKESVAHNDDTSKAAVNDADDFANFHQPVDVISVDPMPMIVDEQEKMISLIVDVSTNSAISQPCYDILSSAKFLPHQVSVDPLADTIETSHFMSFNQPLSHYVLLTGKDFQPLSQICELSPPPPKPPDGVGVVTPMSSLNLSLLVTTAKHFSILQTSLQLFDEMPECHKTVCSAIINRCMDNEQVLAYGLFKDMHKMHNTPRDFEEYPEEKHMHCTTRLVEMLHLCASNFGNCVESDPKKNFLIEEIKVLEEAKCIGLPNFMPRAAFLYLLQRKLGVSTRRAGEELIAKKKNSIQHVMEVDECGKAK